MHVDAGAAAAVAAVSAHGRVHNGLSLFVTDIHFGAVIDKILHRQIPSPERSGMQRRLSIGRCRIHIRAGLHQRFDGIARSLCRVFGGVEPSRIRIHRTHPCSRHDGSDATGSRST